MHHVSFELWTLLCDLTSESHSYLVPLGVDSISVS